MKRKKLEGKMRREERNQTTVHTFHSFLSSNGCVLDRFVINMMTRTLHKHRQLTRVSHVRQSFRQSVFLVRVCLFVMVCVRRVCLLRASSLFACAVGCSVAVAASAARAACLVLPRAAGSVLAVSVC